MRSAGEVRRDAIGGRSIHTSGSIWRRFAAFSVVACLTLAAAPTLALALAAAPSVNVPAATLMTMDGTVLWSHNPDAARRPASTIKLLNVLVVRDRAGLDDVVVVPREAEAVSIVGLVAGQRLTVRQLLALTLVASANDAAESLAIHIAGNQAKYVALMNAKAKALGLKNTHAVDPHGLSPRNYSTASDLATIARQVMADPVLRDIVRQNKALVPQGKGHWSASTTNGLLGSYYGMEGVKTGYTDPAGYCFVAAAKRHGVELLGVVLGADSNASRFTEMKRLLNWGFANYHNARVVSKDTTVTAVLVDDGVEPTVTVHAKRAVAMFVCNDADIATDVVLPRSVPAPVRGGQQLGEVDVYRDGVLLNTVPLVADAPVAASPGTRPVFSAKPQPRPADKSPSVWQQVASTLVGIFRVLSLGAAHV